MHNIEKLFLSLGFLLVFNYAIGQPTNQDCAGAVSICEPIYVENTSPRGMGNVPNEIFSYRDGGWVCMADERNSIWYRFTVNNDGDFGFLIEPNDPSDDYDWALFDITNKDCSEITFDRNMLVSCNAAGGGACDGDTGANGNTNIDIQGGGCGSPFPDVDSGQSSFNALIPVQTGNTYVLCISNWSGSTNGYQIDFGLSSDIGIFDMISPEIIEAEVPNECGRDDFILTFSENIECSTMDPANFLVTGPDGDHAIISITGSNCFSGGGFDNSFILTVDPPISEPGAYVFNLIDEMEIFDLCGNAMSQAYSNPFTVSPDQFPSVDLGNDISDCLGKTIILDAEIPDADTYLWQDNSSGQTLEVEESGTYIVMVTTNIGCVARDTIEVDLIRDESLNLGNDTTICQYAPITLDASNFTGAFQWQDGSTNSSLMVSEPGLYILNIVQDDDCLLRDSILISPLIDEQAFSLGRDTTICFGSSVIYDLSSLNGITNLWEDGSDQQIREISEEGQYMVTVESEDCTTYTSSVEISLFDCTPCSVFLPNIFTPNGDNINDIFRAEIDCNFTNYRMAIYNRWGSKLFESMDPAEGWNGRVNGKRAGIGVYVYVLTYDRNGESVIRKGDLTLVN